MGMREITKETTTSRSMDKLKISMSLMVVNYVKEVD